MAKSAQKDNSHLSEKLALRRYVLDAARFPSNRVLDLCSGAGVIWKHLRTEYKLGAYTPCDRKPRMPACIKMEISDRTLNAFDLAKFNVIDVDTYGEPWLAYANLSKRITQPTIFFLTHGAVSMGGGSEMSLALRAACSIPSDWMLPKSRELAFYLGRHLLSKSLKWVEIKHLIGTQHANVSYYGFLAVPKAVTK